MKAWKSIVMGAAALVLGAGAIAQQAMPPAAQPLAPQPSAPPKSLPLPEGAHDLTKADLDAWLDGYMPFALHTGDLAGAVVTVVKDGQVLTARGYGYADIAKKTPVDPEKSLFRPGSVSKLITWTAVMQQVEAGKIDLDKDINTYLDFKIPARNGQPVTMRQVMTHTAGFEERVKYIIGTDPKDLMPLGDFLKKWVPTRIFDAGTTPAYSNYATALAAYVVQRVSGVPFDDYLDQRIFKPLDMRYSTFRQPLPKALQPFEAKGYPQASKPVEPFELVGPGPAGSMAASGVDMAKFMIAHLQNGRGLLRPETAAMMHNSPTDKVNPRSLIPPLNRMELGFFETNINNRWVIAHLGDTQNFHTSLHLFMKEGVGFYVSFNSAGKQGAAHTVRIALFQDFADRYFPNTAKDGVVDARTSAEHAKMMAGNWTASRRSDTNFLALASLLGQTTITVGPKGELVIPDLKDPSGAVRQWVEIAPFVWRDKNGHDRLAGQVVDGKVVRWSYDMISPFTVFDRVSPAVNTAWLLPALYIALAVLLLTVLYWPVAWAVRRNYGAQIAVSGQALKAYRGLRIVAGLALAVLIGWIVTFSTLLESLGSLNDGSDWLLWLLQIAGVLAFFGLVGFAAWNVWLTWKDGRRWPAKLWSVVVLLSALIVLHVAWSFGMLAMTVNY